MLKRIILIVMLSGTLFAAAGCNKNDDDGEITENTLILETTAISELETELLSESFYTEAKTTILIDDTAASETTSLKTSQSTSPKTSVTASQTQTEPPVSSETSFTSITSQTETTVISQFAEPTVKQGDIITFGWSWYWLVLDVQGDSALIIRLDVNHYDYDYYHNAHDENYVYDEKITWADSSLRKMLNSVTYESMSEILGKDGIKKVTNKNHDNPWYGTDGGEDTEDYIFLLSIEEVVKYFGDSGDLANRVRWVGEYDEDGNFLGEIQTDDGHYINDEYNEKRKAFNYIEFNADDFSESPSGSGELWWLRSPGIDNGSVAFVYWDGAIDIKGEPIRGELGVRIAMWINLEPIVGIKILYSNED